MRFNNLSLWTVLTLNLVSGQSNPPPATTPAVATNAVKPANVTGKMNRAAAVSDQKLPMYVRFLGWPHALTSDSAHHILEGLEPSKLPTTVLDLRPSAGEDAVQGTQILYEKLSTDKDVPLVSVLLMDDSKPVEKQLVSTLFKDKFDMLSQKCSCYWVDGKELTTKNELPKSEKYYLRFVDTSNPKPKFDARSGYFSVIPK